MILLIGSSGYVGSAFKRYFESNGIEYKTLRVRYIADQDEITSFIKDNNITCVINCAGYVGSPNVDSCEDHKEDCLYGNSFLPKQIAKICASWSVNIPHVYISSGCIFTDKNCDNALEPSKEYSFIDEPNFTFDQKYRSWYSGTKALGESLLRPYMSNTLICRLRIPFDGDINPRNYIFKTINYPKLVNCTNSYSNLGEFVESCFKLSQIDLDTFGPRIFNLTQPGHMTTKEVVDLLVKHNLVQDKEFFNSYDEFLSCVRTPRSNCVLRSCSERSNAPITLTPIRESMESAIIEYSQK